jgi:hypothetical protein
MMKSARDETCGNGFSRRKVLGCMTWARTGVLWTVIGGVPRSMDIIDRAQAQTLKGLSFLQISDSHVGFDGTALSPRTLEVPDDKLRVLVGISDVTFRRAQQRLAIIDTPLQI